MVSESKPFETFICSDCHLLWALILVTLGVYQLFRVHSEPGLPNLLRFAPFSLWGWTEGLACMSELLIHWVKSLDLPDLIPEQFFFFFLHCSPSGGISLQDTLSRCYRYYLIFYHFILVVNFQSLLHKPDFFLTLTCVLKHPHLLTFDIVIYFSVSGQKSF